MADGPIPVGVAAEIPHPVQPTIVNSLVHDIFLLALTGASIFVKNPEHQTTADLLVTLASRILNEHFPPQSGQ